MSGATLPLPEFFRRWEERVEAARVKHGLPHATPERQDEMRAWVERMRLAIEPLLPELRAAHEAGFSVPCIREGERLIQDEKFWHPGDERGCRAIYEVHPHPNPEEAPTR